MPIYPHRAWQNKWMPPLRGPEDWVGVGCTGAPVTQENYGPCYRRHRKLGRPAAPE